MLDTVHTWTRSLTCPRPSERQSRVFMVLKAARRETSCYDAIFSTNDVRLTSQSLFCRGALICDHVGPMFLHAIRTADVSQGSLTPKEGKHLDWKTKPLLARSKPSSSHPAKERRRISEVRQPHMTGRICSSQRPKNCQTVANNCSCS